MAPSGQNLHTAPAFGGRNVTYRGTLLQSYNDTGNYHVLAISYTGVSEIIMLYYCTKDLKNVKTNSFHVHEKYGVKGGTGILNSRNKEN